MLVIIRERDQSVMINDDIEVTVVDIRGDKVRLGFTAPPTASVHRKEVFEALRDGTQRGIKQYMSPPVGDSTPEMAIDERPTPPKAAVQIRIATQDDLVTINDIYNWYVPRSTCTYQEIPEAIDARRHWFEKHHANPRHPVTVAEVDGRVVGWGSLSDYRERSAYRFTCESSVYVQHEFHGRGIGTAIVADLIERAKQLDYHTIIAGADAEQTASIALHTKFGFVECGRQIKVGYKFDRWLDVVFLQLMLR